MALSSAEPPLAPAPAKALEAHLEGPLANLLAVLRALLKILLQFGQRCAVWRFLGIDHDQAHTLERPVKARLQFRHVVDQSDAMTVILGLLQQ